MWRMRGSVDVMMPLLPLLFVFGGDDQCGGEIDDDEVRLDGRRQCEGNLFLRGGDGFVTAPITFYFWVRSLRS